MTPTALEFAIHPLHLLVRFESIEASVEQQCETALKLIAESGFTAQALSGSDELDLWSEHTKFSEGDRGALLKVSVLPTELAGVLDLIERLAGKVGSRRLGASREAAVRFGRRAQPRPRPRR